MALLYLNHLQRKYPVEIYNDCSIRVILWGKILRIYPNLNNNTNLILNFFEGDRVLLFEDPKKLVDLKAFLDIRGSSSSSLRILTRELHTQIFIRILLAFFLGKIRMYAFLSEVVQKWQLLPFIWKIIFKSTEILGVLNQLQSIFHKKTTIKKLAYFSKPRKILGPL